jgi:PBP1b-binding outer membrane lipoprotein LpoB
MFKISNGMGRKFIGMASAVALAVVFSGCAKQESVITAQTDTHAQVIAQADIPEVIVTASRDSATAGVEMRHE